MAARNNTVLKRVSTGDPRRNFLGSFSRKRTESNFVIAFGHAYEKKMLVRGESKNRRHAMARELSIAGFGIADFVSIAWTTTEQTTRAALSGLSGSPRTQKATIFAFGMTLKDWRKALPQAFRYRYFADAALVVLPPDTAAKASVALAIFRETQVGLWSFDGKTGQIKEIFTPRRSRPFSESARQKAITILSRELRIPPVS
jgi:hypothetical protein